MKRKVHLSNIKKLFDFPDHLKVIFWNTPRYLYGLISGSSYENPSFMNFKLFPSFSVDGPFGTKGKINNLNMLLDIG